MPTSEHPDANEFELSLFGPGLGESIVIHLGNGNWMVVDSCLDSDGNPIAMSYLKRIGVNIDSQVKLIVASHWHDDHVKGLARLLGFCTSAKFACSAALMNEEFLTIVMAQSSVSLAALSSGCSEMADVFEVLQSRTGNPYQAGPDFFASGVMTLYKSAYAEVITLSPSAQTILDGMGAYLQDNLPKPGDAIRCFPPTTPNETSVALHVRSSAVDLLLGADLERGIDDRRGWRAVVKSSMRPMTKSFSYKVAHHGSEGADIDEIWSDLLLPDPIALLTPYARGRKPLPSKEDVARIKKSASSVYCAQWPVGAKPNNRGAVDKTMAGATKSRSAARRKPGHVRLRIPMVGPLSKLTVNTFDGAAKL